MEGHWKDKQTFIVDDVEFVASTTGRFGSTRDRFCLVKRADLVDRYVRLLDRTSPETIVELGILQGGSTALLALLAEPHDLIAIEKSPEEVQALEDFIRDRNLTDVVHTHYGVDQADTDAVTSAVQRAIGSGEIDLVVDDASHLVGPTRVSFNALFPRLRPGGHYVIEDWSWAHIGYGSHLPDEEPLTTVVFELIMALPTRPGIIDDMYIDRDLAIIRRGSAPLTPGEFDLSDCYTARARALLTGLTP